MILSFLDLPPVCEPPAPHKTPLLLVSLGGAGLTRWVWICSQALGPPPRRGPEDLETGRSTGKGRGSDCLRGGGCHGHLEPILQPRTKNKENETTLRRLQSRPQVSTIRGWGVGCAESHGEIYAGGLGAPWAQTCVFSFWFSCKATMELLQQQNLNRER